MIVNGNLEVIVSKDDFSNLNDGKDFIIGNNADYAILEDKKKKKFKYKILFDYNKQSHIINKDCLCLIEEMSEIKEIIVFGFFHKGHMNRNVVAILEKNFQTGGPFNFSA